MVDTGVGIVIFLWSAAIFIVFVIVISIYTAWVEWAFKIDDEDSDDE